MKSIGVRMVASVGCSATLAALGAGVLAPAAADAAPLQCVSRNGESATLIDGSNACGSQAGPNALAAAYGVDGIGYAKADAGASALGVGVSGGVGASDGRGGTPVALGFGPGSVAITSVEYGAFSLALAGADSQALVADADQGVMCRGSAALALNAAAGKWCLATGLGIFRAG